jgi:uncharacterized small protein (DUF1192 family)
MNRIVRILFITAVCCGVAALLWWQRHVAVSYRTGDAGADAGREVTEAQNHRIKSLQEECARLSKEIQAQSNRTDAAEAQWREEKDTHDPLRKQIEKMIAQDITLKAEAQKKQEELEKANSQLAADLEAARKELDALKPKPPVETNKVANP